MSPGEHLIVIGQEPDAFKARSLGLHLRDTLVILTPGFRTLFAFLLRVPLDGTMTDSVLVHGSGGLQIDACRVFTSWEELDRPPSWKRSGHTAKPDAFKIGAPPGRGINCHPKGRWPSNLILVHGPGCTRLGTRAVRKGGGDGLASGTRRADADHSVGKAFGRTDKEAVLRLSHYQNGTETIAAWECQPDCPVGMLDGLSGDRPTGLGGITKFNNDSPTYSGPASSADRATIGYGDTGTASRFYPQFPDFPAALDWLSRLALLPG